MRDMTWKCGLVARSRAIGSFVFVVGGAATRAPNKSLGSWKVGERCLLG